jgi:hypothetical protein
MLKPLLRDATIGAGEQEEVGTSPCMVGGSRSVSAVRQNGTTQPQTSGCGLAKAYQRPVLENARGWVVRF